VRPVLEGVCASRALIALDLAAAADAAVCCGAWARVTINQLSRLVMQTVQGHRASTDIYSPTQCSQVCATNDVSTYDKAACDLLKNDAAACAAVTQLAHAAYCGAVVTAADAGTQIKPVAYSATAAEVAADPSLNTQDRPRWSTEVIYFDGATPSTGEVRTDAGNAAACTYTEAEGAGVGTCAETAAAASGACLQTDGLAGTRSGGAACSTAADAADCDGACTWAAVPADAAACAAVSYSELKACATGGSCVCTFITTAATAADDARACVFDPRKNVGLPGGECERCGNYELRMQEDDPAFASTVFFAGLLPTLQVGVSLILTLHHRSSSSYQIH
jgi:hypothetical protein